MKFMENLLSNYQLSPTRIKQITKVLYKIEANGNTYALKKTSLTKETVSFFEQLYHMAFSKYLINIIPIYLTRDGKLYQEVGTTIYYLTPWVETEELTHTDRYGAIFQVLGNIHYETKQITTSSRKELIPSFRSYQTACQKEYKKLKSYITIFEGNRYMAPFELQICTQFHHIEQIFHALDHYLDQLIEILEKENEWSYSLCHGNFHDDHILQTKEKTMYVINWEQASYNYPITDIVAYYKQAGSQYHSDEEELLQAFHSYMKENELQLHELYYLVIHLLDPKDYIQTVERYLLNHETNQLELIRKTERIFRVLVFGLTWEKLLHIYRKDEKEMDENSKSISDEKL